MVLTQVQRNAIRQLAKPINIDCAGLVSPYATILSAPVANPPQQTIFPAYNIGYDPNNPPATIAQNIPAAPPGGASSAHAYHALSGQNLHPLLFQIEPYPDIVYGTVPLVIDAQTNLPVFGRNPNRQLRFFAFLPRWINVNIHGELMEVWFRLDPRLQLSDICDRINVPTTQQIPNPNSFNMRRNRFRDLIGVPPFLPGRNKPLKGDVELIGLMAKEQILLNTTMMVDLYAERLLKPIIRSGRITSYVDTGLPVDYFITGFPQPIDIPSDRQLVTLQLRRRLQNLASLQGLGNLTTNYLQLVDADLPSWWVRDGPPPRAIHEIDGATHDRFVDDLVNQFPGIARTGVQRPVVPAPPAPVMAARPRPGGGGSGSRARRAGAPQRRR